MTTLTPEYIERERQLERVVSEMSDEQLRWIALWEIHCAAEGSSDAISAELLRRSEVNESLAKY